MTNQIPPHNPDSPTADWDAIARFLAGESAPAEAAEIRQWLGRNSRDAEVVVSLDDLLSRIVKPEPLALPATGNRPLDVEAALKRAHGQLSFSPSVTAQRPAIGARVGQSRRTSAFRTASIRWQRIAMAAAATLVMALGYSRWRAPANSGTTVAATYQTKVGVRDSVLLPDGSRVVLAPGSRLIVAAGYGNGRRDVELQGEGQFTVRHDTGRPFTVRSGKAVIRDLGTTFTVRTMATSAVVVMVTEGSVSLSDSAAGTARTVELKAGDRGRINLDGSVAFERGSVTPDETAWVTGTLVYRDAPFTEVQADLRRWYGVELVVDQSLIHTVTSRFDNEPAALVLKKIAGSFGGELSMRGDTAIIDRPKERSKR